MLVINILATIAILWAVLTCLKFFDNHCERKFTYRFLTKPAFGATTVSLVLLLAGNWWRTSALQSGGDPLNGSVIIGIGILVALGLIYINFKSTNLAYGIGGSMLQLSLFGLLAYIGIFVLIIGLVLWILSGKDTVNVRVVNK